MREDTPRRNNTPLLRRARAGNATLPNKPASVTPDVAPSSGKTAASDALLLFPASVLLLGIIAGLTEAVILLCGLILAPRLWRHRRDWLLPARWIMLAFALNVIDIAASMTATGFDLPHLDAPLRALLSMLAIGLVVVTKPEGRKWWLGLFAGTIAAALFAAYQHFWLDMPRAEGAHLSIMFGDIAMAMGVASLAALPIYTGTRMAALPYLSFAAALAAAVLSATRGAWLAALPALVPFFIYGGHAMRHRARWFLSACALAAAFIYLIPESGVSERIHQASVDIHQFREGDSNTSVGARLEMWKGAAILFAEHPLFGIGHANFEAAMGKLIARGEIDPAVGIYGHAHNEMMDALATRGVVGGLLLAFMYGAPLAFFWPRARRAGPAQAYALAGALVVGTYILCGLTQVLTAHHIGYAFYSITIAILAGLCLTEEQEPRSAQVEPIPGG